MKLRMISFVAGIAIQTFSSALPPLPSPYLLVVTLLIAALLTEFLGRRFMARGLRLSMVLILLAAMGYCYGLARAQVTLSNLIPESINQQAIELEGKVVGLPNKRLSIGREQWRFDFKTSADSTLPNRLLRLSYYGDSASTPLMFQAGQAWRFTVKLRRPRGFANPYGFDYQKWLIASGYAASGYILNEPFPQLINPAQAQRISGEFRSQLASTVKKQVGHLPSGGFIQALSVGDKSAISQENWELLNRSGTSHLMAISGLHIGVAAGVGWFLGLLMQRLLAVLVIVAKFSNVRLNSFIYLFSRFSAPLLAASIAIFYAALAGFALPTQRALVMILLTVLAVALRRPRSVQQAWFVALVAVLLLDPMAFHSVGFYLSFGAVAALIWAMQTRHRQGEKTGKRLEIKGIVKPLFFRPQWVVFIGLMPLLAWQVGQVSFVSLLANMVAIPVVSIVVVPIVLLATAMSMLANLDLGLGMLSASVWLWQLADYILSPLISGLQWLSAASFAAINIRVDGIELCFALIGAAILLLPKGVPARGLGIILFLPMFTSSPERPERGHFWLDMFDVGQGLSVLIRTEKHNLLYDLGPEFSEHFNTAEAVVLPNLWGMGISAIDTLVISHGDKDHAGGIDKFLRKMPVNNLALGEPLDTLPGLSLPANSVCSAGQRWWWGGVKFETLYPIRNADVHSRSSAQLENKPGGFSGNYIGNNIESYIGSDIDNYDGNNSSCVIRVSNRDFSVLLTGDIEKKAERALIEGYGAQLQSDVITVPHHGSKTSSSDALLTTVAPRLGLVSAGYQHRYGHPADAVVQNYQQHNIALMNTAVHGRIQLRSQFYGVQAENTPYKWLVWRKQRKNWWHALPPSVVSPKVPPL